jgi:DNA repair protein RadA/Sms
MGRCTDCGGWNTFVEEPVVSSAVRGKRRAAASAGDAPTCLPITEVTTSPHERLRTGIGEFDRTLGGGVVPGSMVLVGGDPGIGKSTLLIQSMGHIARAGETVLYVSGEESPSQIKMRAERLGALSERFLISTENCVEDILETAAKINPAVLVVDSVQTVFSRELASAPGSVGQVRETAFKIFQEIKRRDIPTFLIGHITKEGAIAGPKTLEHIVDTVIYFEGEKTHAYRILRTIKNRFGATPEIGVFEMTSAGLVEVTNPSEIFLAERPKDAPGSAIVACLEGTRPLLVEVQALVSSSSSVGMPRRMAMGLDYNRMSLLTAILEKRLGLGLQSDDVFVNIAGGIRISEPAIDLGVAAAIAGSFKNRPIDAQTVLIGEIGLTGEVRSVLQLQARIQEAHRLGFRRCLIPYSAKKNNDELAAVSANMKIVGVKTLAEALEIVL